MKCDQCGYDLREDDGQEMADGAVVHDDCVLQYLDKQGRQEDGR